MVNDKSADHVTDEALWDERYRSSHTLWSGNPNPQLTQEVSGISPGIALDAGCGEGADAIWLAKQGWRVTAVDVSTVALERAADHAKAEGLEVAQLITWIHADLATWLPPKESFDLVSTHFMHFLKEQRVLVFQRLASSVAPRGTLLVVGHHPSDMGTTMPRPKLAEVFFTGDELAAELESDKWDIVTNAALARSATDPEGRTVTIHDTVLRARKAGS